MSSFRKIPDEVLNSSVVYVLDFHDGKYLEQSQNFKFDRKCTQTEPSKVFPLTDTYI